MSKKKIIIIVVLILVAGLSVWYFFFRDPKEIEVPEINTLITPTSSLTIDNNFPLQIGSNGTKVKQLQTAINKIDDRANLTIDGAFGKITKDSLQAFVGGSYYPVTEDKFNYIIDFSNQI